MKFASAKRDGDELLDELSKPSAYSGLYGFHKYWGKKPVEPLRFLVEVLTEPGDLVVDPFLGAGAIAREASEMDRKVLAGDLNPFAVKLSSLICRPCSLSSFETELERIEREVRSQIDESYGEGENGPVSHVLWEDGKIKQVWERAARGRRRYEREPGPIDKELATEFSDQHQDNFGLGRPLLGQGPSKHKASSSVV